MGASNGNIEYTTLRFNRKQSERITKLATRFLEIQVEKVGMENILQLTNRCLLAAVVSTQILEHFEVTGQMDGSVPSKEQFLRDVEHIQALRAKAEG